MTIGLHFSINFPYRLNLVICNDYNAKTSFLPFQASHFSIKNRSTNHIFSKPFLGPPFSHFLIFIKWSILGPPSKSDGVKNPLRVRGRTQQSVSAWFSPVAVSLSCTAPYLTSPFLLLSFWVSVSAGHPAIADARKGGVLGAQQIESGFKNHQKSPKIDRATAPFFNDFSKNQEKT